MNKQGKNELGLVIGIIGAFAIVLFIAAMSTYVLGNMKDTQVGNSTEYNSTVHILQGFTALSKMFSPIGIIVGAVVIVLFVIVVAHQAKRLS